MLFLSDILTKAVARLKIDTDLERGLVLVYLAAYSVNIFFYQRLFSWRIELETPSTKSERVES